MRLSPLYWISAAVITIAGACTAAVGMRYLGKERETLLSAEETFTGVSSVQVDLKHTALVIGTAPDAEACEVTLSSVPHTVTVEMDGGTLLVRDTWEMPLSWFSIGFTDRNIGTVQIILPESEYETIAASLSQSDMTVEGALHCGTFNTELGVGALTADGMTTGGSCRISVGTGKCSLAHCTVQKLDVSQGTGALQLQDVQVQSVLSVDHGTGDVTGSGVTVGEAVSVETGTGAVQLSDVSLPDGAEFASGTGSLALTDVTLAGDLWLETGTGSVSLGLCGEPEDFSVDCSECIGTVTINGERTKSLYTASPQHRVTVESVGTVTVSFSQPQG